MMDTTTSATTEPADDHSRAISSQQLPNSTTSGLSTSEVTNTSNNPTPVANNTETDNSKNETKQQVKAPVKKPTFKAVAVNRTFLSAKANSASQLKTQEKSLPSSAASTPPTTSIAPASRPRLVAKTGGASLVAKGAPASTTESTGVWNKNRPAAQPTQTETKPLTDEELKRGGIHVATRLNSVDFRAGQSNWADEADDDDDGWVPDTITWNDGTKSEIPHVDSANPSPIVTNTAPKPTETTSTATKVPTPVVPSIGSAKTNLVFKASNGEKPSLVAKAAPVASPAKSPWATLPSIDKVSPATAHLPTPHQSQQQAQNQQNMHYNNGGTYGSGYGNNNYGGYNNHRDSYGSRNGDSGFDRRNDYNRYSGGFGPNRPRQGSFHDHHNATGYPPREVSQDSGWNRDRRGSMNMNHNQGRPYQMNGLPPAHSGYSNDYAGSMGSGGYRRTSFNDGPRRPSFNDGRHRPFTNDGPMFNGPKNNSTSDSSGHPAQSSDSPYGSVSGTKSPSVKSSDVSAPISKVYGSTPWQRSAPSPAVSHSNLSQTGPVGIDEDTIEFQKKLMREKAEEAMRRRHEQEAKEEAAKQERLRRKLEALGPAPERMSEKKATPVVPVAQVESSSSQNAAGTSVPTSSLPVSVPRPRDEQAPITIAQRPVERVVPPAGKDVNTNLPSSIWDSTSGPVHAQQAGPPPPRPLVASGWGGSNQPRNVWGAPNNDRGLGNGAFINDLPAVNHPAPIGPPSRKVSGTEAIENHNSETKPFSGKSEELPSDVPQAILKPAWRTENVDSHRDVKGSAQAPAPQPRTSRFFPTREVRNEPLYPRIQTHGRARTPSPPPPITEDHPVYDVDHTQSNVPFSRPVPVVRLPYMSIKTPGAPGMTGDSMRTIPQINTPDSDSQGHWKNKINDLLSDHKPPSPILRRSSIDENRDYRRGSMDASRYPRPISRGMLMPRLGAYTYGPRFFETVSRPMSTDCFEEPELGSLPSVKIPLDVPAAAFNPAAPPPKSLPRRFMIINNTTSREPDLYDNDGKIRIWTAKSTEPSYVTHPCALPPRSAGYEGKSRRGKFSRRGSMEPAGSRGPQFSAQSATLTPQASVSPVSHGDAHLSQSSQDAREFGRVDSRRRRGSLTPRESSDPIRDHRIMGGTARPSPPPIGHEGGFRGGRGRRGRGGYRGRGGSDWGRRETAA